VTQAVPERHTDRVAPFEELGQLLDRFKPIGLDDVGEATLLRRTDRKFMIPVGLLSDVLPRVVDSYRALEIEGGRLSRYSTQYFDTPALALYHEHHRGSRPRSKVRVRTYLDTGERYLEFKRRISAGGTLKSRVKLPEGTGSGLDLLSSIPAAEEARIEELGPLEESVRVRYQRVTLVHSTAPERVTLDIGLNLSHGGREVSFPGVVCVEVKQARRTTSQFVDALRALRVIEGSVSKYCLGVVSLVDHAKKNRFKQIVRRFQEIEARHDRLAVR
jgi:hypothetical protein